jgi:hypothetical protein
LSRGSVDDKFGRMFSAASSIVDTLGLALPGSLALLLLLRR